MATRKENAVPAPPVAESRGVRISVHMKLKDGKEWTLKALDMCDAIDQGRAICKANGYNFRQDTIVWDKL